MTWKQIDKHIDSSIASSGNPGEQVRQGSAMIKRAAPEPLTVRIFPDHWWDERFWTDLRHAGANTTNKPLAAT